MAISFFHALLAILGLGVLVFIHELGHYFVARRQGMKVEAFAIGFGKPLFTWERNGVKWRLCMLPFGGYVKIAGMQKEGNKEPYEIPDGFYGKSPWQRIKVAVAGPLVNIVFALIAFIAIWLAGGRDKQFAEFTHRIGWVDPKSALYQKGVRPGDVIQKYDGRSFDGFKDLMMAAVMDDDQTAIQGYKIDYTTGKRSEFDYTLSTYEDPRSAKDKLLTIGVLSPARYLIFEDGGKGVQEGLPSGSPMLHSGIQPKDRILWVDGEMVFSPYQLSSLINESTVFLTVQRGETVFQTKAPRVVLDDLKMSGPERGEFDDWQHEAAIKGRLQDLYFIPYNLSPTASIESRLSFIDEEDQKKAFQRCQRCAHFTLLEEGDQILAVDGHPVSSSYELLERMQTRRSIVIVERNPQAIEKILWTKADQEFDDFNTKDLEAIISSIGTKNELKASGPLHLLNRVVPKPFNEFPLTEEQKSKLAVEIAESKKEIEAIQDPQKRSEALTALEKSQKKAILGVSLKDREVIYNPGPIRQFVDVFKDTWRTLAALVSGYLNPKYMQGPVGIVTVVQQSWMLGAKEALFWLAVISLNLGIVNLLPIPVLDGGHIAFSLLEMVTKRPLKAKTMERLILPFIALLLVFFVYITYQDIARLFSKFF
ncbi:MAG: RIP metalloprotease RseP [Chlamydiae bacterium RIFCSPHIGHO2_12_FULL_49_9]|nr:MAG: RIP metalloprotease RseP [Chlamydiae bacterium RIFCSPHIGHO2_12_FULL_49_9]